MLSISELNTARQVAYHRARGARDAANAVEARADEMPGDVARQLMKHHADGFNALITDAVTPVEILTHGELRTEIQTRMAHLARPPQSDAERAQVEQELAERIHEEGADKKAYADETVQVHTGAMNQLDALMENDRSRLRRAGSLNRIVRRMQNGQATSDEFAFFHDPADESRPIVDRSHFDLGYGILQKRREFAPVPDNAARANNAEHLPQEWVAQAMDALASLEPQERLTQLLAFHDNPDHPRVFTGADQRALHAAISGARSEHAMLSGDEGTLEQFSSPEPTPSSSRDITPEHRHIRAASPPPLQRRNAVHMDRGAWERNLLAVLHAEPRRVLNFDEPIPAASAQPTAQPASSLRMNHFYALLHPSSLRGYHDVGDLDPGRFEMSQTQSIIGHGNNVYSVRDYAGRLHVMSRDELYDNFRRLD